MGISYVRPGYVVSVNGQELGVADERGHVTPRNPTPVTHEERVALDGAIEDIKAMGGGRPGVKMGPGQTIHIVFDGPPSHEAGRFVEVESPMGCGIHVGEWVERPDGYWALVIQAEGSK